MQMAASMTFLLQTLFVTMSVRCFLNGMPEYIDSPWPRFYSGIAIAIKLQEKLKRIIELIILKLCLFFFFFAVLKELVCVIQIYVPVYIRFDD